TLHMAMLGIRDLSVIQTPPPDRQAIRTFVAHFDDATIRDSILRELNRGGQGFFVHNRVEKIDYMASHLRSLGRDAKRRIDALRELVESESGGGFKLAMADLEHRGAGNLLGHEQHGQIAAVGFELYTEMMEEAID